MPILWQVGDEGVKVMARKYIVADKDGLNKKTVRPSERMFRRSRAAENRRRLAQNKETKFTRFVIGLAGILTMIVFMAVILMTKAYAGEGGTEEVAGFMTRPLVGKYTPMDLMGFAFVIVAGYAVYRKFNSKQ